VPAVGKLVTQVACPAATGLASHPEIGVPPTLNATVPLATEGDTAAVSTTPGTPTPALPLEDTPTLEAPFVTGGIVVVVTGGERPPPGRIRPEHSRRQSHNPTSGTRKHSRGPLECVNPTTSTASIYSYYG
jgi:hypothetical protein